MLNSPHKYRPITIQQDEQHPDEVDAVQCTWCGNWAPSGVPIDHADECEKGVELRFDQDTRWRLYQFLKLREQMYQDGSTTKKELEEARSYAVEIINGLVRNNPEWFHEHFDRMRKIKENQQGG